ncbi:Helicase C domain containing protein, partial [Asbolus verrucosus]
SRILGLMVESFISGLPEEEDVKKAKQCHIAVGAPGRVKHLIMILMKYRIHYPKENNCIQCRSWILFLHNYMLSPTHDSSKKETPILLSLKQFVVVIKTSNPNVVQLMKSKNEKLLEIFSKISFTQYLVFSNYQTRAESIGVDAPNVDLVINYDIPQDAVTYLHRMGRAGRYGSSGICINLAFDGDELKQIQAILGMIEAINLSISMLPLLNEKSIDLWQQDLNIFEQICRIVSFNTLNKFSEVIKNEVMAIKVLLSVTKLLCNPNLQVDLDTVNSIEEYLSLLETKESNRISVEEILNFHENNTDEHPKTNKISMKTDEKEIIEDIFKLGYKCAAGKEKKNWLDCLPQEELLSLRDLCKEEIVISSDSCKQEDEEEQDYEVENFMEEENEVKGEEGDQNQDCALQWFPVVRTENSSDLQNEHFMKCYEDCSNVLWQNGLTFKTV